MRWHLLIAPLLLLPVPAQADCMVTFNPGSGNNGNGNGGQPGSLEFSNCVAGNNTINISNASTFNARFADIENQININRKEARAGIAAAMAAASMGVGGAASGAGAGKLAAGLGFGEFEGTVSLSAGLAYSLSKQFNLSAGVSIAPLNGRPSVGLSGGATLVLN